MQKGVIKELPVAKIDKADAIQVRVNGLDDKLVKEYAAKKKLGATFPPIAIFAEKGSQRYVLADGLHTLAADKQNGSETITCIVREGDLHDAKEYALGANDGHGLRRTSADKRNAVAIALNDPEWCEWSNADIGRLCKTSTETVRKVRRKMIRRGDIPEQDTVKTTRKGKTVVRKATAARSNLGSEAKNKAKTGTSKRRRVAKTQDQSEREEVLAAIAVLNGRTYDGTTAFSRLNLQNDLAAIELGYAWLGEILAASKSESA